MWSGDLQTEAGLLEGLAASDKLCLNDLTANAWMGKEDAENLNILDSDHVRGFLCYTNGGGDPVCNSALPSTTYFFATSGDNTKGGASFITNLSGQGPNDSANWTGASYFDGDKAYWTGRTNNVDTTWDTTNPGVNECADWSNGTPAENGEKGRSSFSNKDRWSESDLPCNIPLHLICMVHP
jgi:hypothetical protein